MIKKYLILIIYLIVLFFNIIITLYFIFNPPVYALHLDHSMVFSIWPSLSIHNARWFIAFGLVGFAICSIILWRIIYIAINSHVNQLLRWILHSTVPLGLLPLVCSLLFFNDIYGSFWSTNLPIFLLLALISIFLARFVSPFLKPMGRERLNELNSTRWAVLIFIGGTLLYTLGGNYFSATIGEHVGDEGHYLLIIQSLAENKSLDLKNNILELLDDPDPSKVDRGAWHLAPNSLGGAWYSWHPHGLPLLLAPFWEYGVSMRQFVLGLISAAGLAGLFLTCRRVGAGSVASLLTILSLGTSYYWMGYSFRTLPEILGATLLIWTFWAIASQSQRPWVTVFVAATCCVYMLFSHARFVPMSLMGIGLYGLSGLLGSERAPRKLIRLSTFSLLCMAGYVVYLAMQFTMFEGGTHTSVQKTLFSNPIGAIGTLLGSRGIISIFPVFVWILCASILWFFVDKKNRFLCCGVLATFAACMAISTTNFWYTGGSSIPGRYIVVAVPLLFIGTALILERSEQVGRVWFFFLTLFSTMLSVVVLFHLENVGRYFVLPIHRLSSFPFFQDLFFPYAAISNNLTIGTFWATFMVFLAVIITMAILVLRPCRILVSAICLLALLPVALQAVKYGEEIKPDINIYFHALPVSEAKYLVLKDPYRKRPPWSYEYAVERFHGLTGTWVLASNAKPYKYRIALQDQHQAGMLAFGRHQRLFPGLFSVIYSLRLSDDATVTLDVALDEGRSILAQRQLISQDENRSPTIELELADFSLVEPRVYYDGVGNVIFEGITIVERTSFPDQDLPELAFTRIPIEQVRQIFQYYIMNFSENDL